MRSSALPGRVLGVKTRILSTSISKAPFYSPTTKGGGVSAGLSARVESWSRITLDSSGVKNMAPSEILRNSSPAHLPDMIPLTE